MRIDQLTLKNFRCFSNTTFSWNPQFNLIAGKNGKGKTTILEGLAIAMGSWLLGVPGYDSRHVSPADVRLEEQSHEDGITLHPQYPVVIGAVGDVDGEIGEWRRELRSKGGRTTTRDARFVKSRAEKAAQDARAGRPLPLLSYYGTCRLCLEPRQMASVKEPSRLTGRSKLNPLSAYRNSVDPRLSSQEIVDWIARQSWIAYQQGSEGSLFPVVREAMLTCVEGAHHLYFDARRGELVFEFDGHGRQPFGHLSDGQRCMLALVGDMAERAVRLNPHLGSSALQDTPGIVLIDELELHLHPSWQRAVAGNLTRTFPSVQFFCTTHSPQIIGEVPRGQVFLLDDRGSYRHPPASRGLDSNEVLEIQDAEPRDRAGLRLERAFLAALDDLDLYNAERLLGELRGAVEAPSRSISRWEALLGNSRSLVEDEAE